MAYYDAGGRTLAYDNIAVGSVAGQENVQAGSTVDSQALPPAPYSVAEAPAGTVSVSALSRTDNTATATATAHGLRVGQIVLISGADQLAYNRAFRVESVADANTFTFTVYGSPTSPATGTILCQPLSRVSKMTTTAADFNPTPEDVVN